MRPGAVNLTNDIPNKYIYDAFLIIYLSMLLLLGLHFWVYFKGVNQMFTVAVIL